MGYSNYPDGMRESDIPGWDDIDCPACIDGGDGDTEPCECLNDQEPDPDCPWCDGEGEVPQTCSLCDGTGLTSRAEIRARGY